MSRWTCAWKAGPMVGWRQHGARLCCCTSTSTCLLAQQMHAEEPQPLCEHKACAYLGQLGVGHGDEVLVALHCKESSKASYSFERRHCAGMHFTQNKVLVAPRGRDQCRRGEVRSVPLGTGGMQLVWAEVLAVAAAEAVLSWQTAAHVPKCIPSAHLDAVISGDDRSCCLPPRIVPQTTDQLH